MTGTIKRAHFSISNEKTRMGAYTVYVKECYDCYEINALKEHTVPSVLYQRAAKA